MASSFSLRRFTSTSLLAATTLIFVGCWPSVDDPIPRPKDSDSIERGRELAKGLAACGFCHGDKPVPNSLLSGGLNQHDQYGDVAAANLTPAETGLAEWTAQDVVRALRASLKPNGKRLSKEVHRGFEWMSDSDTYSITAYLGSIPPIKNEVSRRRVGFLSRNIRGFFDVQREVRGYVPDIDPKFDVARGGYLADNVARCFSCHNSPPGFFGGEDYLTGGRSIINDAGEKIAPSITASEAFGIGSWTEEDIVHYLHTGISPDGDRVDSRFCPVGFYSQAADKDLIAIAKYLKALEVR